MHDLTNPIFNDETAAREYLESCRWPDGPICPHCGRNDGIKRLKDSKRRSGLYQCNGCRKQFTVRVGSVFERSHIPLHKWVLATHLLCSSKKGMSAHQLHRMLGITYKSAWFMAHRIREAMHDDNTKPMTGGSVQADETYIGKVAEPRTTRTSGKPFSKGSARGPANKRTVVSLVSSDGEARTFHVKRATANTVRDILVKNVSREAELHTDESRIYTKVGEEYKAHRTVNHSAGEYAVNGVTTNNVENYFSVFKRGMRGVYQHCSEKHLQRYLSEYDFRYNNRTARGVDDTERAVKAIRGAEGKRLTYRRTDNGANV